MPPRIRDRVIRRDQVCQLGYQGCTTFIEEVDHIINVARLGIARADANDMENLQGVCRFCHRIKTRREATAGQNAWKRRPERHPGLL